MKNWKKFAALVVPMAAAMAVPSFAGQWEQAGVTYQYREDDGSYAADTWQWIDGNGDGIAERYHFNAGGYLDQNTVVDGSIVNESGAWVVGGNVQQLVTGASQEEIAAVYQAAADKANAQDSVDASAVMDMTMNVAGETLEMDIAMDMKATGVLSGNMELLYDMNIGVEGETIPMTMFYQDGTLYYDMLGMKIKMPMDMDEAMEQAMSVSQIAGTGDTDGMVNMKLYRNGDQQKITYDMDTAVLNEALKAVSMGQMESLEALGYTYNVTYASGTIELNADGYGTKEAVSMGMEMSVMGETVKTDIDMTLSPNNPGQPVVIQMPSTEGYVDLIGYADAAV